MKQYCATIFILYCCIYLLKGESNKYYINEAETDIMYDEQTENLDIMATVDIALSSFVIWNIFSIFSGMFICCFIQTGYYKFQNDHYQSNHNIKSIKKETPY